MILDDYYREGNIVLLEQLVLLLILFVMGMSVLSMFFLHLLGIID